MTAGDWSGHAVEKARTYIAARLPLDCSLCGKPVRRTDRWVVAHIKPRWQHPELTHLPSNWGADHRACSDASGQAAVVAKAYAAGAAAAQQQESGTGAHPHAPRPGDGVFDPRPLRWQSPPLPVSLPTVALDPEVPASSWEETVAGIPWLGDLATIPADGVAPRYMTGPHPLAVGSYGDAFLRWVDEEPGLHPRLTTGLRWFQRLVAVRLLEHDLEGRLLWRNALVTMARQVGKSWLLRALLIWRIHHPELWGGEEQTVVHMAHRMGTANEVWRPAARWAMAKGWRVRWANGEQVIETPTGGRWLIKAATDGVGVGYALSVILADEGWMIPRAVIEAADPALTESESPQLLLVSTAGDSASDLFGTYRANALGQLGAPVNTLIVEWSAPRSLPVDDPAAWRLASPHWSERRYSEILDKVGKLEELEFRQNYLNQWVEVAHGRAKEPGLPFFAEAEWGDLDGYSPGSPSVAAVESWFGEGLAVATAEAIGERVGVSVILVESVAAAAAAVAGLVPRPEVLLVGKSVAEEPALVALGAQGVGSTSRQAVEDLRQMADDDVLRHDSSPELAEQVLSVRTVPGSDGPRVRSVGRMDAVKAVVFAAEHVRKRFGAPQIW